MCQNIFPPIFFKYIIPHLIGTNLLHLAEFKRVMIMKVLKFVKVWRSSCDYHALFKKELNLIPLVGFCMHKQSSTFAIANCLK